MYYNIITTLHLVSVISWMVGLLYLPRLFVYHYDTKYESQTDKTFLLMEYRLLKIIMKPAMVLTYIFGFLLVYDNSYLVSEVYFILKLLFVFFLTIFHFYLSILYKNFKKILILYQNLIPLPKKLALSGALKEKLSKIF